jgi:predicted ATP-grasp superfamily ATP-dependent carboligase
MPSRPEVLLVCASDWTAPARLPRVLAAAGARVSALCAPGRALAATRFVHQVIEAPLALGDFIETLRTHLDAQAYDWVLIADDPLLEALRVRRHEPWLAAILPIPGTHPWSAAIASKADFCRLAGAAGLPQPPSRVCLTLADARAAAAAIGLPLVLKESAGFAGLGVRLVRTEAELDAAFGALEGGLPLVAQRFVDGPVGNTVFLMDRGRPVCWMSAFKARTYAGPFGPSSARRFMAHDDVEPLLERFGACSGYHGLGALDWVLDAHGRLVLIELNARPVPTIHMGPRAGVDFARAVRQLLAGRTEVQRPPAPTSDGAYAMFPEDLWRAACEKQLRLGEWLSPRGGLADLPWHDPPLLLYHVRGLYRAAQKLRASTTD